MKTGLMGYEKIVYSQWGEDGIIEEIFNRIGALNKTCVEFGAGFGMTYSNVWYLIKDLGWRGLLMEPSEIRFEEWGKLVKGMNNLKVLNTFVEIKGENSLDNLLQKNNIPKDLDLLSIDIDSDDYYILESLTLFLPRVVMVEYNPTIPPEFDVVQSPGEKVNYGASAKALVNLAHRKNYKLAAITSTNCIFVRRDEFEKLEIEEPEIEEIFDRSGLSYLISAVNGSTYLITKNAQPCFAYLYNSYSLYLKKKFLHALSFGFSMNKEYSSSLSSRFRPVKVFWSESVNTVNFLQFLIKIIKDLFGVVYKKIFTNRGK